MKKGKKLVEALKKVDRTKVYTVEEAVKLVKDTAIAKFDGNGQGVVVQTTKKAFLQSGNVFCIKSGIFFNLNLT